MRTPGTSRAAGIARAWARSGALALAAAITLAALAAAEQPAPAATPPAEVDLAFTDAEVRDIFAALADAAGWSFVGLPELAGRATMTLKGLTVEQALDMVARATGFAYVRSDTTLVVGTRAALESRFDRAVVRPEAPQQPGSGAAEPVTTEFLRLDYAKAAAMKDLATMVLPEEAMRVDEAANMLIVRATAEQLDELTYFLEQYDRPPAQVLIEARVEEVLGNATEDLGVVWQLPEVGVSLAPRFGSVTLDPEELLATLHTLEEQGLSRLVARPQVTTLDGQTATIFIGDEVPVILKGQGDAPDALETISAGVRLEITPLVGSDGTITAEVKPEVSTIAGYRVAGDQQLPQIRTRKAQTRIRVRDGEPIVIGGLINEQERETTSGLPVLQEFPVVGGFFSTQRNDLEQSEMLIFLIPRVLQGASEPAAAGGTPGEADEPVTPGSVLEGSGPGRFALGRLLREPLEPWTLRLDMIDAQAQAWKLGIERPVGRRQGATTSIVRALVSAGTARTHAWGLGLGWRWYYPSARGGGWLGAEGEVMWPSAAVGPVAAGQPLTILSVEAGARSPVQRLPLFVEPFVRWVPAAWGNAALVEIPRRGIGLWLGLTLGWAF